jgi:hypothetical protein
MTWIQRVAQQANATDEWLARRAYLKPDAEKARLGPIESRSDAGTAYAVLTAIPIHGQPVELWFDPTTGFLARTVRVMPTTVEAVSYGNYNRVGDVLLPHRITTSEGTSISWKFTEYHLNPAIDNLTFQPPRSCDDDCSEWQGYYPSRNRRLLNDQR